MTMQMTKSEVRLKRMIARQERIDSGLKKTMAEVIEQGRDLCEQKAELKHGEWIPWVEENMPIGIDQAGKYMRIFKNQHELNSHSDTNLTIDTACQMLATPKPVVESPVAEEPVIDEPDDELDTEWEEVGEVVEVTRVQKSDILQEAKIFDRWDKVLRELNKEIIASTGTEVGSWIYIPFYNQAMKRLRSVLAGFKPVEICCDNGCEDCRGTGFLSKVERDSK